MSLSECWACGATAAPERGKSLRAKGWRFRRLPPHQMYEAYCAKCFAEYGWPATVRVRPLRGLKSGPRVHRCHAPHERPKGVL